MESETATITKVMFAEPIRVKNSNVGLALFSGVPQRAKWENAIDILFS